MARTARVVAFSTTPEMAEQIDRMAGDLGSTRSQIMREAFELYAQARRSATKAYAQVQGSEALNGAALAAESAPAYGTTVAQPAPTYSLPGLAQVLAHRDEIRAVCEELGVRRLWLFGSAVRDDFEPGRSDFDFQVEWAPDLGHHGWASEFFELQGELSRVLDGQKVDLGEAGLTKNPYVRAAIEGERLIIHESTG